VNTADSPPSATRCALSASHGDSSGSASRNVSCTIRCHTGSETANEYGDAVTSSRLRSASSWGSLRPAQGCGSERSSAACRPAHDVEGRVREPQVREVALAPLEVRSLRSGPRPGDVQQLGVAVQADHVRVEVLGGQAASFEPDAAARVERAGPRPNVHRLAHGPADGDEAGQPISLLEEADELLRLGATAVAEARVEVRWTGRHPASGG
jgi:hypothetical protein